MIISTIKKAEEVLARYVPTVSRLQANYNLERIKKVMSMLGDPQEKLQVFHVAGTSGKTSTCYYLSSMVLAAGKKVGLTVSPHVDKVSERVQINGQPLDDEKFCSYLAEFIDIIEKFDIDLSYFELIMAFAYWVFAEKEHVDVAVIETGCGGLLDGTNVINNPKKVCIITDIGLDHVHLLGNTISAISSQKAGIIHAENKVYMYSQSHEVDEVFIKKAKDVDAKLTFCDQKNLASEYSMHDTDLPLFQRRNWLLAAKVFTNSAEDFGLEQLTSDQLERSLGTYVPARMDYSVLNNVQVIMDGAHNEQKMTAFVDSFIAKYPGQKVPVVLALKHDKDHSAVLNVLKPIVSKLIVTKFENQQDLPTFAESTSALAEKAVSAGYSEVVSFENPMDALNHAVSLDKDTVVVTGSFYLISQLRSKLAAK